MTIEARTSEVRQAGFDCICHGSLGVRLHLLSNFLRVAIDAEHFRVVDAPAALLVAMDFSLPMDSQTVHTAISGNLAPCANAQLLALSKKN